MTTPEALGALVAAFAIGVGAGSLSRTRWILLLAPITFIAVFELARIRVDGPTVDGIALNGLYGVIALVGGRGIDAVLMLLPLVVGCSWGLVLALRLARPRGVARPVTKHLTRRGIMVLSTGAVVLLAASLLRPASTETIVGNDGEEVSGSIAELAEVPIGGHDQGLFTNEGVVGV